MPVADPYRPPAQSSLDVCAASPSVLGSLFPACLAVVIMMLLWVVFVSTLEGLAVFRNDLFIWSTTLLVSSFLATLAICQLWKRPLHPIAFGIAFSAFSGTFAALEGDSSELDVRWNLLLYCGTLIVIPLSMYGLVFWRDSRRQESGR